jgi:hypothetical protein
MDQLRDFVADILERRGAAVEAPEPEVLEVLSPEPLQQAMRWPELARLGFGVQRRDGTIAVGLEGDWLERFGALLGDRGRWAERQLILPGPAASPADPERLLDRGIELPNAIWRLRDHTVTVSRCLILWFRYTAISDEKREGLIRIGYNLGTGAVLQSILDRLFPMLAAETPWQPPEPSVRVAAGPGWNGNKLADRVHPLLEVCVRKELEQFLHGMRRRLERDRNRVHAYHDDLRDAALARLSALAGVTGEKAEGDRRREALRVAAIERAYQSKLGDLRHNYALRVTVEWVQALELYVPVQRFDVLIRRRKGERLIRIDWHPSVRMIEPPPCEWGPGDDRVRLVCDEQLHLTEPAGQAPCPSCGKAWCRACHGGCPRCGHSDASSS